MDNELTSHSSLPDAGDRGPLCADRGNDFVRMRHHFFAAMLSDAASWVKVCQWGWQVHRDLISALMTFLPLGAIHHGRPTRVTATAARAGWKGARNGGNNKLSASCSPASYYTGRKASKSAVTLPTQSDWTQARVIRSCLPVAREFNASKYCGFINDTHTHTQQHGKTTRRRGESGHTATGKVSLRVTHWSTADPSKPGLRHP